MEAILTGGEVVTLCSDRGGNEWIIFEHKNFPEYEAEITPSDDPPLFLYFKQLIKEINHE